jgi:hypothetical protein
MKLVTKGLLGFGAFFLVTAGAVASIPAIERGQCTAGNQAACDRIEARDKRAEKRQAERFAKEAERKAALEKREAEKAARKAKNKAAEAKLKAEGWFEVSRGIYGRWCTQTCSTADVIGSGGYWLMEIWAKDRAAGDIYGQVNIIRDGVVVGWTNDTLYLDKGQRGILTFQKYGLSNPASYTAQLVKFNARG